MTSRSRLLALAASAIALAAATCLVWVGQVPHDVALSRASTDFSLVLKTTLPTIRSLATLVSSRLRRLAGRWQRDLVVHQ